MNIELDKIIKWLSSLNELQAIPLTFIACLAIGSICKWLWFIKNEKIPAVVILSGPIVLTMITDFRSSEAMTVRVFVFRTVIIGLVTGLVSWVTHKYLIKKLTKKWVGNGLEGDSDPKAFVKTPEKTEDKTIV